MELQVNHRIGFRNHPRTFFKESENQINPLRIKKGLTYKELANRIGCSPGVISNLALGYTSPLVHGGGYPKEVVERIAVELGATVGQLFPRYVCELSREELTWEQGMIELIGEKRFDHFTGDKTIEDLVIERDRNEILKKIIKTFPEREQVVIENYFFKNKPLHEIAETYQVTRSMILIILQRSIRRFRAGVNIIKLAVFYDDSVFFGVGIRKD